MSLRRVSESDVVQVETQELARSETALMNRNLVIHEDLGFVLFKYNRAACAGLLNCFSV